ncbi:uncharacterized protein LOC119321771 isoform X2 [Triticum dicoccoides]|uniref:uncharacterized protein LOC119321771 isoform X2 n=1 Tax=Triticum dicoccoides TaxID=85692 RepID=UPI0018916DEF|nr:uncharacterized protein LOC119321771 isoform X2 [Triticum dicoccoides]
MEEGGRSSAAPWLPSRTLACVDAWCEAGDAVPALLVETETRWPTDMCSTARNCFHGFLGHLVMEMPPCFTNARCLLMWLQIDLRYVKRITMSRNEQLEKSVSQR